MATQFDDTEWGKINAELDAVVDSRISDVTHLIQLQYSESEPGNGATFYFTLTEHQVRKGVRSI